MKKNVIIAMLLIFSFIGCNGRNSGDRFVYWDKKETIKYWDGESIKQFEGKPMAAMLWLRPKISQNQGCFPAKHQIYKRFDDNDYNILLECLKNPEKPRSSVMKTPSGLTSTLYLSFLDGSHYIVYFSLEHETAILQNGYSQKLYSLFAEKEISPAYNPDIDGARWPFEETIDKEQ